MPVQYTLLWTLIFTAGVLSDISMAAAIDQTSLPLLDRVFSSSSVNNSAKGETKSNNTGNINSVPVFVTASSAPNITELPLQHRSDDSIFIEAPMLDPIVIVAAPDLSGATTIFKNVHGHQQQTQGLNGVQATTKSSSESSSGKTGSATHSSLPGSSILYSLAGVGLLEDEADPRLQMAESLKARFPISTRTSGETTEKASKARLREDVDDSVEANQQHEAGNLLSKYENGDSSRESRSKSPIDHQVYLDIGDTGADDDADYDTNGGKNNYSYQPYYEEDSKLDTLYRGDLPRHSRYRVRNHRDHPENPRLMPGGSNNLDEEDVINVHQTIKNNPDSHDGLDAHRPTPSSFGSENGLGQIGGEDIADIGDDVMDDLDEPTFGEHVGGTGFRSATTPGSSDGSLPAGDDLGDVSNVGTNVGNNIPIPSGPIGDENYLFDSPPSSSGEFFSGPEFGGLVNNGRNRFPGRGRAHGFRELNDQHHGRWHHGRGRGMLHGRYHPGIVNPRHLPWQRPRNMFGARHLNGRH